MVTIVRLNITDIIISFSAWPLNVSNSFILSLVVLSNTIIASATIAIAARNASGNSISGAPLYVIFPNIIPVIINNSISGTFVLFASHEHIAPMNSSTAIAVVMFRAVCISMFCIFHALFFIL